MKNCIIFTTILFVVLFLTACSSPSEDKFMPQIVDRGDVVTDSLQQIFGSFDFPAGLVPVMVLEDSIDDLLKSSAHTDDIFNEISDEREDDNFKDFGLLIYITKVPRLMQVRLGNHYVAYSNLCAVTSGKPYLELQQRYTGQGSDAALGDMLKLVCQNVTERNNLSWWQRTQLSNIAVAINGVMDWFGTPSKNFYGTMVSKPVYTCISYGNKTLGSWVWGIVLVFVGIFAVRWAVKLLLSVIIPWPLLRDFLTLAINTVIGFMYSLSSVGCAMYFSSGRLEDLYAIKAFGIPNVEAFISDPSMFVQNSSFLTAGLFVFLILLTISLGTLCSDIVIISSEPVSTQMARWNSLSKNRQDFLLGANKVTEIKPGETPYQAIYSKMSESLGEKLGTYVCGLTIGALFFFPKAVLWTGIAFSITKIALKTPRLRLLLSRRFSGYETGTHLLGSITILILVFTAITMALYWWIDPFNRKADPIAEHQSDLNSIVKKVVVIAKTANLRTGPGTTYDYATKNSAEKWQVKSGDGLDVISEHGGWYKVRVGNFPQEVYIKKSLCKDDINVGLYGSLPFGKSYFEGSMDGYPIEFTIIKNKKTGKITGVYKNVKYKTIMKLKGETMAEQMGKITFYGTENNSDWFFSLTGDKNHITGLADGNDTEFSFELRPK